MQTNSAYTAKSGIRTVKIGDITIGGDSSISFMSENSNVTAPLLAIEIPYFINKTNKLLIKKYWGCPINNCEDLFDKAIKTHADLICININITEESDITDNLIEKLSKLIENTDKQLILKGTKNKAIDKVLLPKLAKSIKKQIIIASADDGTYEDIVSAIITNNHILVLRSPIDINLAKELNILSMDMGLSLENILIDSEMGALGYGLDYGYSIIEKIRLAGLEGDNMLNMPVIAFVGEETIKTKEAKSDNFPTSWGDLEQRTIMWEISAASSIISAGANLVVVSHPKTVEILKEVLWD